MTEKEYIEVYRHPTMKILGSSKRGIFTARFANDHNLWAVGSDADSAVKELLRTLKFYNRPHDKIYYEIKKIQTIDLAF